MTLYNFFRRITYFIFKVLFKLEIEGKENIPEDGRLIICSNHIHMLDPIVIAFTTGRPIHFMAKKELFENKILAAFLTKMNAFPVDRDSTDIKAVKKSLKILKAEEVLGIFPEGTRVKSFDKENAKAGVSMIAHKTNSNIVPIKIESDYRLFRKLSIKIGPAFSCEDLDQEKILEKDYKSLSEDILSRIYEL